LGLLRFLAEVRALTHLLRAVPQHSAQNLSSKDGGASGLGVRDRIECGHADCPSVSPGVAVSGESDIGGFFGGSTTVCGRCSLRVAGSILLLGALAA
jgi:hypothetical protein